jgi:hypothetical protein
MLAGGVYLANQQLEVFTECELVLAFAARQLVVTARVVHADGSGIAVEFTQFSASMRDQLANLLAGNTGPLPVVTVGSSGPAEFVPESNIGVAPAVESAESADSTDASEGEAEADTETETDAAPERLVRAPAHERLRNLPVAEQIKLALKADTAERILLERIYGKGVWEPLLRNPRITPPEVARIAKMGSLPRPLLELIVGNGAWLGVPEVRRALLANPRLSTDVVPRILRLMPKHELKLVPTQTAYASGIREHARRMLKDP